MENTTLASTQHTSGRLKNGSPLMWWLHALSLKFSFRKKNMLFRCVLNLFDPYFLHFSFFFAYMMSFFFPFQGTHTKSSHMRGELSLNLPFLILPHFDCFF